jgi:hypothetical protein
MFDAATLIDIFRSQRVLRKVADRKNIDQSFRLQRKHDPMRSPSACAECKLAKRKRHQSILRRTRTPIGFCTQ